VRLTAAGGALQRKKKKAGEPMWIIHACISRQGNELRQCQCYRVGYRAILLILSQPGSVDPEPSMKSSDPTEPSVYGNLSDLFGSALNVLVYGFDIHINLSRFFRTVDLE
jgi:hypothetical protein